MMTTLLKGAELPDYSSNMHTMSVPNNFLCVCVCVCALIVFSGDFCKRSHYRCLREILPGMNSEKFMVRVHGCSIVRLERFQNS